MKSGFVSFVGRPNVGKSTLLNMLIGEKIAIMSPVAQTTRTVIQGIKTSEKGQIVIVDTPGIHKPKDALGTFMNDMATISSSGVDVVAMLFPANEKIGVGDQKIIEQLKQLPDNIIKIAILSKIDTINKSTLINKLLEVQAVGLFSEIIPVSAKKRDNLAALEELLFNILPEAPMYFDAETTSMQSDVFVIKEFIREKVLHLTKEEVPHSIAVVVERWEQEDEVDMIDAAIIVERKSQKAIIIGNQGSMIKAIRQQAERDLRRHFGHKVELTLWVKVEKNWRSKTKFLHEYGYNLEDYQE